ncbi:MAG: protein kinase [Deltaproteobacteria bacterium]|jgi:serine/threonine protein kinase|nr:protein kinase [Deltaproteobacteria bacterium]
MLNLKKDTVLLSRFRLSEMLGQGGMGQVWLVWDHELEIHIAAKILDPQLISDPHRVQLLKNECRNTRRLAHPNIVRVFDFHRSEDLAFISMEYVHGQNLNDYRRQHEPFGISQIISLIKPVVNALGYAHKMGLVHRDVKAGNILIDQRIDPRLTDFGIAGVFKSGPPALEITSGGSLFCMSPQQLDNLQPAPSDDIYALGVLLYQMITGYPPFYPDITLDRIRHEPPAPVNQRLGQLAVDTVIPDSVETLIAHMLAKAPADRPRSMPEIEAFFDRMLAAGNEPTLPPQSPAADIIRQSPAPDQSEMIAPVSVTPTKKRQRLAVNTHASLIKGASLLVAFILLVAGGLWLWHYLASQHREPAAPETPISEQNQTAPEATVVAPEQLPQTQPDPTRLAAEKMEADNKLAEFMQLKQTLEAKGVSKWGAETYQDLSQFADQADRLLIENQYGPAADKYAAAIAKAQQLVDQMEPVFKRLLAEGQSAIEDGDGALAEEKFSIALLINPDNSIARDNLQRAKNSETVMRLLESGTRHENEGNLAAAHTDYQEAARLDPASNSARQALARVDGRLRDQQYQQLMSDGLTAIHNKNYQLAQTKLRQAKALRPESREVNDALIQVDQSLRLARIETYRRQAVVSEQSENWQQALDTYEQVLAVDSTVQFAVQGKQRALKHIRIDKRLDFFLKQPALLESDLQLENARELMAEIEAMGSSGPRLQNQYHQLARIVTAAQTPVKIILESDSLTDIAVYRVGKLGRFASRELNLRPGSYTVVGTRDGYQDVRKKIIVKPEQEPMRVTIRCEVKI